jgi:putative spermidine/putrescine transport system ATP-binding protein
MSAPFLEICAVSKQFGGALAVADVSLTIAKGEFVTFLGPSGSGKSTTLYMIAGFFDPTAGDIHLEGKSILELPCNRRNIGMVFQRYTLFPHLTVTENIAFPLRVRRRSKAEVERKVREMLSLVRLDEYADRMPAQLSGGQQQRVALARALAYDPPLLLMDEPLSALDKKLREEIQGEIRRIHRETGVTIIYVTHDQEEALRLSDRVALFNRGRIEQVGGGRDLYNAPATRFVADFVGHSNFLGCTIVRRDGVAAEIAFADGSRLTGVSCPDDLDCGVSADLMVRPDRIRLLPPTGGSGGIGAVLTDVAFVGESLHVTVSTGWGQALDLRLPATSGLSDEHAVGEEVRIGWSAADARLFAGEKPVRASAS